MTYSLSTQAIADTVHALVSLELLTAESGTKNVLSPLIDPQRRGVLTLLIKNAFAETVLDLLGYVDDAVLDAETSTGTSAPHPPDDDADHLLQLTFRNPGVSTATAGTGIHGVIRRNLETNVVLRVICNALSASSDNAVRRLDADLSDKLRGSLDTLVSLLAAPASPFLRKPFYV